MYYLKSEKLKRHIVYLCELVFFASLRENAMIVTNGKNGCNNTCLFFLNFRVGRRAIKKNTNMTSYSNAHFFFPKKRTSPEQIHKPHL